MEKRLKTHLNEIIDVSKADNDYHYKLSLFKLVNWLTNNDKQNFVRN